MNSSPKVSVIVPVYNAEKYLRRCLEGLCHQTLTDIEIICVDDCSTDRSLEILREYAAKYPQLRVHACEKNCGESVARNFGLRLAQGEYLGFVDNDDEVDLDFFRQLYDKASSKNLDIVRGEVREVQYDGKVLADEATDLIARNGKEWFFNHWWTAIYRHELIKANDITLPEGCPLGGDILFQNKAVLSAKTFDQVRGIYYTYHRREDSGDSKVLSAEKVISSVDIAGQIIQNTLRHKDQTSERGVAHIVSRCLELYLSLPFRTSSAEALCYCIENMVRAYWTTREYVKDGRNIQVVYEPVLQLLELHDADAVETFYRKNNSPMKLFLARVRNKVRLQNDGVR